MFKTHLPTSRLQKFHHAGVACHDIEGTLQWLRAHGTVTNQRGPVFDEQQSAQLCLIDFNGTRLELVSGQVVEQFVRKHQLLYHLCFEVADLQGAVDELVDGGCLQILPPKPAALFDGRLVTFLMGPLGIIELLEQK